MNGENAGTVATLGDLAIPDLKRLMDRAVELREAGADLPKVTALLSAEFHATFTVQQLAQMLRWFGKST